MKITNVDQLRDFLATQLEKVSDGKITPAIANASANLTGKLIQSVNMEMDYNRMVGATPNINFMADEPKNDKFVDGLITRIKQLEKKAASK